MQIANSYEIRLVVRTSENGAWLAQAQVNGWHVGQSVGATEHEAVKGVLDSAVSYFMLPENERWGRH